MTEPPPPPPADAAPAAPSASSASAPAPSPTAPIAPTAPTTPMPPSNSAAVPTPNLPDLPDLPNLPNLPDLPLPDRLDAIATRPAPPTAVDIDLAMADGKRAKRKRQLGVMSWSIAGVLALSAGALVTARWAPRPDVTTASGRSSIDSPSSTGSTSLGSELGPAASDAEGAYRTALNVASADPFIVGAKFGWLPPGFTSMRVTLADNAVTLVAATTPSASTSTRTISLSTFPVGWSQQSVLNAIGIRAVTAVEAINGHPAFQVAKPQSTTLLWQLSDAAWAEVDAQFPAATSSTEIADFAPELRHVATTVVPDMTPVALPIRITGLPSYATVNILDVSTTPNSGSSASSTSAWSVQIGLIVDRAYLLYDVGPVGRVPSVTNDPKACTSRNGLEACVTFVSGELSTSTQAAGRVQALANDVTLLGPSPSTWTTDVFATH